MPVPDDITDLSTTIASNSPAGSDFISGNLDDYLRAGFGIQRSESLNKNWIPYGDAPTYSSARVFTLSGDLSTRYTKGRPIKATVTAGTAYGVVTASSYSAPTTTVTVLMDIALDAGLSRVDLGAESRSQPQPRNYAINSWFRFWQRNTTFTTAAGGTANTADGWAVDAGTSGVVTCNRQAHTQGQTVIPFELPYYMRYAQGTGGTSPILKQRIEDVMTFADQTVTIWFMAFVTSGSISVTPRVTQVFGTGGAPSSNVTTSGVALTVNDVPKLYTSTIKVPSISGKTIGTDLNTSCVRIELLMPSSTTFTLEMLCMGVNTGPFAVVEAPRQFDVELVACRRRYYKTFKVDTVPAQNTGDRTGAALYSAYRAGANANTILYHLPMRLRSSEAAASTITFYSTNAATANWYRASGGAESGAASLADPGGGTIYPSDSIAIENAQVAGDAIGDVMLVHFSIDCEYASTV